jgi:hypothetical protein
MLLTLSLLKEMAPKTIIDKGEVENSPNGIFMTDTGEGKMLKWIAVRGGIHDWAIYTHWADKSYEWILKYGDKVHSPHHIKKLVACDDEAFAMYRH